MEGKATRIRLLALPEGHAVFPLAACPEEDEVLSKESPEENETVCGCLRESAAN